MLLAKVSKEITPPSSEIIVIFFYIEGMCIRQNLLNTIGKFGFASPGIVH